jgi:hypothetical protein
MKKLKLAISLSLVLVGAAAAQEVSLPLPDLVVGEKLPKGYSAKAQDLKSGDKILGKLIVVTKPNQVSKVLVRVELRDLSGLAIRRAATKAYVNGFASSLGDAGYSVIEMSIPDIAKENFEKPVSVGLVFANKDGKKLWTHQEIFFTDKGFAVQVIADDANTFAALKKWANTIKAKNK